MDNFIRKYANISNPITEFFNKIYFVSLYGDYSKQIEWLEAMKKVPLYVKSIKILLNDAEKLENLTDPNLHNTPINNLELNFLKNFKISPKTIENLKAIYPNSITLSDDSVEKDESTNQALFENFNKLLSKLDRTSLEMDFQKNYFKLKLEFRDVIFKVMESNEECSYIRAKSVEIRCEYEELYLIK